MAIIRPLTTVISYLFIIVASFLLIAVWSFNDTLFAENVPSDYLREKDTAELTPELLELQVEVLRNSNSPVISGEVKKLIKDEELDKVTAEVEALLSDTEKKALTEFLLTSTHDFFSYLHSADEDDLEFKLTTLRPIFVRTLSETTLKKYIHNKPTICSAGLAIDCIEQEDWNLFLEKVFAGEISGADIRTIYPQCGNVDTHSNPSMVCLTDDDVNILVADSTSRPILPDHLIIPKSEISPEVRNFKETVLNFPNLIYILLAVTIFAVFAASYTQESSVGMLKSLKNMAIAIVFVALFAASLTLVINRFTFVQSYILDIVESETLAVQFILLYDKYVILFSQHVLLKSGIIGMGSLILWVICGVLANKYSKMPQGIIAQNLRLHPIIPDPPHDLSEEKQIMQSS